MAPQMRSGPPAGPALDDFLEWNTTDDPDLAFIPNENRLEIFQARIQTWTDDTFTFSRNHNDFGEWADCAVVRDDVDKWAGCVAWLHDRPNEWWLYAGRPIGLEDLRAPVIMGMRDVRMASFFESDVYLVATPEKFISLSWTGRTPGPMCCVLDWGRRNEIALWLSLPKGVRCENTQLAQTLGRALNDVERLRHKARAA